ncbi:MAG TPA: hypothetical protein VFQ19_00685 [Nocardioidaceae bacterium]|nr:hypothetical protein [Nocardioidaceae bacterium]
MAAGSALLITIGGVGGAVAANSIGSKDIRNGSVRSADLRDGAVKRVDVGKNAVGGSELVDGSVGMSELSGGVKDALDQRGGTGGSGPAGPAGQAGPAGPAGADGVSGYEVVSKTSSWAVNGNDETVLCPAGKAALGGGINVAGGSAASPEDLGIDVSYPSGITGGVAHSWTVAGYNYSNAAINVTTFAVCASVG